MFLHLSVILFTGACVAGSVRGGSMHGGYHAWRISCMAGETDTAADGTHPTGMHSCSLNVVTVFSELSDRKIVFQKDYSNLQPLV